ncbi:MAG: PD40 domain-containing protein [Myxococcales bacterium]|nr:PD40 domain-containing protein [Myxococcales bacterium]
MIVLLLGCGGSGPTLSGTLAWIAEEQGAPTTRWALADRPSESHAVTGIPGAVFPAEADPQGTHLLVIASEDGPGGHQESLWLVPVKDPGPPKPLGEPSQMVRNPAWSPDGAWLVYESDRHAFRELYRVQRDGTGLERLTDHPNGSFEPDVAPDGAITFVSSRDGNAEVYVMGPHGEDPFRVTTHPGNDTNPTWSPDGKEVAWLAWRGESVQAVRVERGQLEPRALRADGHPAEIDRGIAWSPQGDRVAITTQIGPKDVAVDIVDRAGVRLARLDGPGPDEHPSWSPDGQYLVFASSRDGEPDLYVADRDGRTTRPWLEGPAAEWLPRWGP